MYKKITIVDYGLGNILSAEQSIKRTIEDNNIKAKVLISNTPKEISNSTHVVLPGQGAFKSCIGGLNKIEGMFAFCLYDKKENKLLLARDKAGEKPLYISADNNYLSFSSDLSAIKKIPHFNVAVGVIWKDDRILIAKRKLGGLLGGLWEFPGGKLNIDESSEECVIREIYEETGLSVELKSFITNIKHQYSHFSISLDSFHCIYKKGKVYQE